MKSRRSKKSSKQSRKIGGKTEGDNIYNCEHYWVDWVNSYHRRRTCKELNDYYHYDFPGFNKMLSGEFPTKQKEWHLDAESNQTPTKDIFGRVVSNRPRETLAMTQKEKDDLKITIEEEKENRERWLKKKMEKSYLKNSNKLTPYVPTLPPRR